MLFIKTYIEQKMYEVVSSGSVNHAHRVTENKRIDSIADELHSDNLAANSELW